MSTLLQWVICFLIGVAAASYLSFKYFVHKQLPGSDCGKCKGCATTARLDLLARQEQSGSSRLHRPNG